MCGNVWYLGENTKEYENGKVVSTAGSWEAGVDGAQAGVVVPADPQIGMTYRQEYYQGEAEDSAEVLSLSEQAQVPFGHFRDVLLTKDSTALQPRVLEYKLYAMGIGPVLVLGVSGEQIARSSSGSRRLRRSGRARPAARSIFPADGNRPSLERASRPSAPK